MPPFQNVTHSHVTDGVDFPYLKPSKDTDGDRPRFSDFKLPPLLSVTLHGLTMGKSTPSVTCEREAF